MDTETKLWIVLSVTWLAWLLTAFSLSTCRKQLQEEQYRNEILRARANLFADPAEYMRVAAEQYQSRQ